VPLLLLLAALALERAPAPLRARPPIPEARLGATGTGEPAYVPGSRNAICSSPNAS
jgi:hypothetical protein